MVLSHLVGINTKDICEAVTRGNFQFNPSKWSNISQSAKDLISNMLTYDPRDRISAFDALEHEWFKKFETGEIKRKSLKSAFHGLK